MHIIKGESTESGGGRTGMRTEMLKSSAMQLFQQD